MPDHFTTAELVKCAEREVAFRRNVYPRRVENGRMSREAMLREIAMMEAIAERLKDQQRLL